MKIIVDMLTQIYSKQPDHYMRLELFLSDWCNYNCSYCSTDFKGRTTRWPKINDFWPNVEHLLNYYQKQGKKHFIIHIGGGEPTQWNDLGDFIRLIKSKVSSNISVTTNGSRNLRWWKENVDNFDHVGLSVHYQQCNVEHLIQLGDFLYENNKALWANVLMDPYNWDTCVEIIEKLKTSKHKWSISSNPIVQEINNYTEEQRAYLNKRYQRQNNLLHELFISKRKRPKYFKVEILVDGKKKTVDQHWLLTNGYTEFMGWECSVGLETAFIDKLGNIRGGCGNFLFNENNYYNIYDKDFINKFNPAFQKTICKSKHCWCQPEVNCSKTSNNYSLNRAK